MPEENAGATEQASVATGEQVSQTGAAGQEQVSTTSEQGSAASTTTSALSPEAMAAELERARREAASERTKRQSLEAEKSAREKAEMTEVDRLKAEAAEQKTVGEAAAKALRNERAARVIERKASAMSFIDTEDALRGIDMEALDFADDGSVKEADVEAALKDLAGRKPHWIKGAQTSTTSATNGAKTGTVLTRQALDGMTEAQIAELLEDPTKRDSVMAALSQR